MIGWPRRFEFVPLWSIKVFLLHAPRRVECPVCGVRVEAMPWASEKNHLHQPSEEERSTHNQGAAENLRLLPLRGGGEDLPPGSQLPENRTG